MVLGPIVLDLGLVLMFLVGFALCLLAERIVRALFGTISGAVGWIPWLNRVVAAPIHSIEQKLTNALGTAIHSLEGRIGAAYHSAARLMEETAGKIESAFALSFALTEAVVALPTWPNVLALYHSIAGKDRATISTIREHTKAIHAISKGTTNAYHAANAANVRAQAIPADVVIPGDLTGLRGRVKEAEHEIGRLWDRVRGLSPTAVAGIGLGALAFALGRLGLGWLRCHNVGKVGRNVCGMDQRLLEALLADTLALASAVSIVELAHELQGVMPEIMAAVRFGIREAHAADLKIKAIA